LFDVTSEAAVRSGMVDSSFSCDVHVQQSDLVPLVFHISHDLHEVRYNTVRRRPILNPTFDTARMVFGGVYVTVRCPSVCPFSCFVYRPLHAAAAGLLLWARQAGVYQSIAQQHGAAAG